MNATFTSPSTVPVSASSYISTGNLVKLSLGFAPTTGTNLTVVENTSLGFISGRFDNLAQGATVWLQFNNVSYKFVADYYGGTGNDLVLRWGHVEPVAWGSNQYGVLGDGLQTPNGTTPVEVFKPEILRGKTVLSITAGHNHSLALYSDGTLFGWGTNSRGQLGNGTTANSNIPLPVLQTGALANKRVVAISAGMLHSLALCSDGSLVTWGEETLEPALVPPVGALAGKSVVSVRAGVDHSLALCSDGTMAAWKLNSNGGLEDGIKVESAVPVQVPWTGALAGKSVRSIAVGRSDCLALCSDGSIAQWRAMDTPTLVPRTGALSGRTVVAINAGHSHQMALCSDGNIAVWGSNSEGEYGNGITYSSPTPVLVKRNGVLSGKTVTSVTGGFNHTVALCSDGTAAAWGGNRAGGLGNGTWTDSNVPVRVSHTGILTGKILVAVTTGTYHSLALAASSVHPDSTLAGLELSHASLSPAFRPEKANYVVTVANGVGEVTLTPSLSDPYAKVKINGVDAMPGTGNAIPLSYGANTITVQVSTADGTSTTSYVVKVFRTSSITHAYVSASDVPVTVASFDATGLSADFSLTFAPPAGTDLKVIDNIGIGFIKGKFGNLPQGQSVTLSYNGINYRFVANYYGGTGNDLVLVWARRQMASWGYNYSGQLGNGRISTAIGPLQVARSAAVTGEVIALSGGGGHSLAVCADGSVVSWGRNDSGQLGNGDTVDCGVPISLRQAGALSGKTVVAVSAGVSHSLALLSDGTVVGWGANSYGQLGNGITAPSISVPVQVVSNGVLAGKTVVAISAGMEHSLALCSDGTLVGWGNNQTSLVGEGPYSVTPVKVSRLGELSGKTIVGISAGSEHSLVLCSDGTVGAWGMNDAGQLGTRDYNGTGRIKAISSGALAGKTAVAVAAGYYHSMALCSDGSVAAWGLNQNGELGNGTTDPTINYPVLVSQGGVLRGKTVTSVSAGYFHNLARCSDGTVVAWGMNDEGQLGDGVAGSSPVPVLPTLSGVLAENSSRLVSAGSGHSMMISTDGTVTGWGSNSDGQLGTGVIESSRVPVSVDKSGILSGKTVVSVVVGYSHSLALCADGTLAAWGSNEVGQLGDGDFQDSSVPVEVTRNGALVGKTVVAIAAGLKHSVALCSDGTVAAWGWNTAGQLGNGTFENSCVPVPVLRTGGLLGKSVVSVDAGDYHNLALCDDGTIAAWGSNLFNGLGDGKSDVYVRNTPVSVTQNGVMAGKSVVAVTAGAYHSIALCSDGALVGWGLNTYTQLGIIAGLPSNATPILIPRAAGLQGKTVISVSAGQSHTVAVCSDGSAVAWGWNASGQLGDVTSTFNSIPLIVNQSGFLAGKSIVSISTQASHNLAICSDGSLAGWGYNRHGQIGDRTSRNSIYPVAVDLAGVLQGKRVVGMAAGGRHSLAITTAPESNDSALSDLVVHGGSLSSAFSSGLTTYSADIPEYVGSLTLTPVARDVEATVLVNGAPVGMDGSAQVPLAYGANLITMRVTASDGIGITTYVITANRGTFGAWIADFTEISESGPLDDPDHDSIPNLLEYVLTGNPAIRSPEILPVTSQDLSAFRISFVRRIASLTDTRLLLQYSSNLETWSEIEIGATGDSRVTLGEVGGDGNQMVTVSMPKQSARMYFRLMATR